MTKEMAGFMNLETPSFRRYILNEIVLLTNGYLKCCCCNMLIACNNELITEHLESEMHKNQISMLSDVEINMIDDECEKVFKNHITIMLKSASSLVEKKRFFKSLCYQCHKIVSDGINGVRQHLKTKEHLKTSMTNTKDFCSICNVTVADMKIHVESYFHKSIKENNDFYKLTNERIPISTNVPEEIILEAIIIKRKNLREYVTTMMELIKKEQKCQKEYVHSCMMLDLTVEWEGEVGVNSKPLAHFTPNYTDEEFFKLKLGDELVIYSSTYRLWSMSCRIIKVPSFENEKISVRLTNGTGVKKNVTYPYKITLKWRDTVFWRMLNAILHLKRIDEEEYGFLLKALLDDDRYSDEVLGVDKFDHMKVKAIPGKALVNVSQLKCIRMALKEPICIIQGPPGTGKTETCINIIHNLLLQKPTIKILVSAQSNAAVDLLAKKLHEINIKLIRYFSSRYEVIESPLKHLSLLEKTFEENPSLRAKYKDYCDVNLSEEEMQEYSNNFYEATMEAWDKANVVCCTCITAGKEDFKDRIFEVVLIDEASQVIEPETLVPISLHAAKKVILVGDHKQLGPVLMSDEVKKSGLAVSLFERLIKKNKVPNLMLNVQYRMHPIIAGFSKNMFYDGQIDNGTKDTDRLLPLEWLGSRDSAMIMVNVSGIEKPVGKSFSNEAEAKILLNLLKKLISNKIEGQEISIISPYDGQRRLIQKKLKAEEDLKLRQTFSNIKVANVDGFQGEENEVIILTCVRSNYDMKEAIGFLKDQRRMNVALTRARRKLFILGNVETLKKNEVYAKLISYVSANGTMIEDNTLSDMIMKMKI